MRSNNKIIALVVFALFGCQVQGPAYSGHLTDSSVMINDTLNSTAAIVMQGPSGLFSPICTAFYISPRILATANHCVVPPTTHIVQVAPGISIEMPAESVPVESVSELGREILIVNHQEYNDSIESGAETLAVTIHQTKVVQFDTGRDIALIELISTERSSEHFFRVSDTLPTVGSRVYEIGMPAGELWLFTQGIVSSIRRLANGHSEVVHQANVTHGASGGPLFNDRGEIVGVTTSFIQNATYIGYAASSVDLLGLLHKYRNPTHKICTTNQCLLRS